MSTALSLRDKAAQLRRQHILDAATGVFAERGFHRATVRDVALAAGVSDGAIYTVFENKQALLLAMLDPLGEADGPPPPPTEADPAAFIRAMIRGRWAGYTPPMLAALRVVLSEVLIDRDLRALFLARVIAPALSLPEAPLAAMADAGALVSDDMAMTLRLMVGAVLGVLLLRLFGDERLEAPGDQVPDALAALLLGGLLPRGAHDAA